MNSHFICKLLLGFLGAGCIATPIYRAVAAESVDCIPVTSKGSLIHLGSLDSFDITEGGKQAARYMLDTLETGDTNGVSQAIELYKQLIPKENFGGEYTGLKWICEYLLAPAPQRKAMIEDPVVENFQQFWAATNHARLKYFLYHKYHLEKDKNDKPDKIQLRFLEDFILFNNPNRDQWERTKKLLEVLPLKAGDYVADIGSGPGFYSFEFARRVGPTGRVYASDINPRHCEYMSNLVQKLGIKNVEVIYSDPHKNRPRPAPGQTNGVAGPGRPEAGQTNALAAPGRPDPSAPAPWRQPNAIGLSNKVELAFLCSLYHVLYTHTDENLAGLLESIKAVLKPEGILAVIDNAPVQDDDLPYFGPFIAKELVAAQLKQYGFRLTATHQFIPQRYLLLFKQDGARTPTSATTVSKADETCLEVKSRKSLVRLGAFMPGEKGHTAAQNLLEGLEQKQTEKIRLAKGTFAELIPLENFGGEYTALEWFCNYYLTPAQQRPALLTNALTSDYLHFFAENDWAVLIEFLQRRYNLAEMPDQDTSAGEDRNSYLQDVIFFNNPRREEWEKTSFLLKALQLKPGEFVADVGCGTGYYSFPFAEKVGPRGRVFAIETNEKHVNYMTDFVKRNRIPNVRPIRSKINDICLNEKVDVVFLCSLYPMIYLTSMEKPKDQFIESIKTALKPDGRLVIVDNDIVELPTIPYHASCIDRRLVIAQLKYYGFRLVETHQSIPQRYMLVFQKTS